MNIFELVGQIAIEGLDKAEQQLSGLEGYVKKNEKAFKMTGAAIAAFGVAGLKMVSDAKRINAQLGIIATTTELSEIELRKLTLEMTNVTFAIQSVADTLEILGQAGIKNAAALNTTAIAMDRLADATDSTAEIVAGPMVVAMKTFQQPVEDAVKYVDKMAVLLNTTTLTMDNFSQIIGQTRSELVEQGLTMDDTLAMLALMEQRGESGTVAMRAWIRAQTESIASGKSMADVLGFTTAEIESQKNTIISNTAKVEDWVTASERQFTIMDKLKQKISEFSLAAGTALEPIEGLFAGMTALGSAIISVSVILPKLSAMHIAHTAALVAHKIAAGASAIANWALTASFGPLGLLAAIVAVTAALAVLNLTTQKNTQVSTDAATTNNKLSDSLTGLEIAGKNVTLSSGSTEDALKRVAAAHPLLQEATEKTTQVTDSLSAAQMELEEQFARLLAKLNYNMSAAGDYGITIDDVYESMLKLGMTTDDIRGIFDQYGEDTYAVNKILQQLGLTARDVAFLQGKLRDETDRTTAAFRAQDAAIKITGRSLEELMSDIASAESAFQKEQAILALWRERLAQRTGVPTSARDAAVAAVHASQETDNPITLSEALRNSGYIAQQTSTVNVAQLVVREEADIQKIARELYRMQQVRI